MIDNVAGFKIVSREFMFSGSSMDELRHEVWSANELAETTGAIFYPGKDTSKTLVIFAGYMEKFTMLSIARNTWCNILIFQDLHSTWYQGSDLLPPIAAISSAIEHGFQDQELFLFGQAAGGYAALYASKSHSNAKVLAVSPHTFSDGDIKRRIQFGERLAICYTPEGLEDLKDHLEDADKSTDRVIICASSEVDNPSEGYFWLDHLHSLRMVDVDTVRILMPRLKRHSSVPTASSIYANCLSGAIHSLDSWPDVIERCLFNLSMDQFDKHSPFP